MFIAVGYTNLPVEVSGALDREAARHGYTVTYRDCTSRMDAYHGLLEEHWQREQDFIVCEHDVVIDERCIPEFEACPEVWCGFGYELAVGYRVCLGLTRFRAELMNKVPGLFDLVQNERESGCPPKAWYRLDVRIDQMLRERDYVPHLHMPPVRHLNERQKLADPIAPWAPTAASEEHTH